MEVVPYWVIIPYGFVEKMVILDFVCAASDIRIKRSSLVVASLVGLFFTLAIRAVFSGNIFILALSSILSVVAIIWVFTGIAKISVWIAAVITFFIISFLEFVLYTYTFQPLLKNFNFIATWILTGIPHIAVLFLASIFMKKVKANYATRTEETA